MSVPTPPIAATTDFVGTDLDVSVGAWALLGGLVVVMLLVDLLIFGRAAARSPCASRPCGRSSGSRWRSASGS